MVTVDIGNQDNIGWRQSFIISSASGVDVNGLPAARDDHRGVIDGRDLNHAGAGLEILNRPARLPRRAQFRKELNTTIVSRELLYYWIKTGRPSDTSNSAVRVFCGAATTAGLHGRGCLAKTLTARSRWRNPSYSSQHVTR